MREGTWVSDGTEQNKHGNDSFQIPNQYYDVTISYDGPEALVITKDQNPVSNLSSRRSRAVPPEHGTRRGGPDF